MTTHPPTLTVHLTRTSATHHRLEIVRDDGSREACELETRSCLRHDLVHFALESEARLADAFFGRLARGVHYLDLGRVDPAAGPNDELEQAERIVGPLQSAARAAIDPEAFVARLGDYADATGEPVPRWVTPEQIARTLEHLRRLEGRWQATAFGATMTLRFCAGDVQGGGGV